MVTTKATKATGRRRITNAHQKAADAKAAAERNTGASAKVQQYLESRPGEHIWASEIMQATGLPKRAVQNAIGYLRSQPGYGGRIGTIRPGNAWTFRTEAAARKPLTEETVVERRPVGGGASRMFDPDQAAPQQEALRVGPATVQAVVHTALPGGALIISLDGQQYHAKPLS